jgi:hypothetical protein
MSGDERGFDVGLIPKIAAALDPERKQRGWWRVRCTNCCASYDNADGGCFNCGCASIGPKVVYFGPMNHEEFTGVIGPIIRRVMNKEMCAVMIGHLEQICWNDATHSRTFPQWLVGNMTAYQYNLAAAKMLGVKVSS